MELDDTEFIRRFAMHILSIGCVRIRHGILSVTSKKVTIPTIRQQLNAPEICFIDLRKIQPFDRKICPCYGKILNGNNNRYPSVANRNRKKKGLQVVMDENF